MDLDKLLQTWKDGRLKYPQLRREAEDAFFGGLVEAIKTLEHQGGMIAATVNDNAGHARQIEERLAPFEAALDSGSWPAPPDPRTDRMAAARAAKAAKRDAPPLEAA